MLRNYKNNDEIQINKLFSTVFKTERSLEEWKWKYDNSLQHSPIITVFEEDGKIIGHAAALIFEGKTGDKPVLFAERVDVMVHADHRGKGIYQKVITHLMEECRLKGIHFVYGYPAPKAKELFIRYMKGNEIASVPRLIKVLSPIKLLMSRIKLIQPVHFLLSWIDRLFKRPVQIPSTVKIQKMQYADERFNTLWDRSCSQHDVLLKRTSSYLNWRYFSHPSREYEVYMVSSSDEDIGYFVLKRENVKKNAQSIQVIHVIDLFFNENGDTAKQMVKSLMSKTRDADIVSTWALSHTLLFKSLKKHARFLHVSSPMPLVGKSLMDQSFDQMLFDQKSWYVSQGDVDSY